EVLQPLTDWSHPTVRVIVGVRSAGDDDTVPIARTLAGTTVRALRATELRADTAPLWTAGDLIDYITHLLRGPEQGGTSPYRDRPEAAGVIARELAALAGTSYVVAQIAARNLANQGALQDP